jgi:hypothetical protein
MHRWRVTTGMHFAEASDRLAHLLGESGLAPELLSPWPAWKVFKRFLREPVDGASSDALVQVGAYDDGVEGERIHLYLVRQFSNELAHDLPEHDKQIARIVCDLAFPTACARIEQVHEIWSQDYRSRAAFVDAVEGDTVFQRLMNAEPVSSRIYWEES